MKRPPLTTAAHPRDTDDERSVVVRAVESRIGLKLQKGLFGFIDAAARDLLRAGAAESVSELVDRLAKGGDDDPVVQRLSHAASICETYFFRHPEQLEALYAVVERNLIIPKRKRGQRRLHIWSVASSTGEEAYTLAMMFATRAPDFQLQVLGTDMNLNALNVARDGLYRDRSFRNSLPPELRTWLVDAGNGAFRVADSLKSRVRFLPLNLVTDSYPSPDLSIGHFDVVVCRNVLIYLQTSLIPQVMDKLSRSAAPDCVLALTPAEYSAGQHLAGFEGASHALFTRTAAERVRADPRAKPPLTVVPRRAAAVVATPINLLAQAQAAADRNDFASAQSLIGAALRDQPDLAGAYLLLGRVIGAAGQPEHALKEFQRALFLDRSLVEAELGVAQTLTQLGQGKAAKAHFERALRLLETEPADSRVGTLGVPVEVARRIALDGLGAIVK